MQTKAFINLALSDSFFILFHPDFFQFRDVNSFSGDGGRRVPFLNPCPYLMVYWFTKYLHPSFPIFMIWAIKNKGLTKPCDAILSKWLNFKYEGHCSDTTCWIDMTHKGTGMNCVVDHFKFLYKNDIMKVKVKQWVSIRK